MNRLRTVILITIFPILGTGTFFAQKNPELDSRMKNYTQNIDSIVVSEREKMNVEIEEMEKKFQQNEISSEEKQKQIDDIASKYEQIINEKVDAQQQHLENDTKVIVKNAVFMRGSDTVKKSKTVIIYANDDSVIKISRNKKKKEPKDFLRNDDLSVSYAFLNLTKSGGSLNPFEQDSKMRIGNSHSFEIQARRERQLGNYESPFFIRYGFAYRSDTYMPKKPLVVEQNTDEIYFENFADGNLKRSKLRNVYLTFPVDFQWVLNPKYIDYEGKKYLDGKASQFRIGLGVYVGINLRGIVKVKYHDENGKFQKYDYTLDSGVNTFLFGAKFSVRYAGINLFIKKDFTPIFNGNAQFPSKNGIHFGIDLMDLNL
ncbi:MAG: PorT family protein [Flavobacteriaceae bacterium]|jgi:hypothetical protein|nr:PorT family protein [Flavobacteriaceae bacterium]